MFCVSSSRCRGLVCNLCDCDHTNLSFFYMYEKICQRITLEDIYLSDVTSQFFFYSFVCFVALRPKSTAMVIAGRSVHLTTLFPGQA